MSTVVERARNLLAFAPDGFDPTQEEAQQFVLDALLIGEKCARVVVALDAALPSLLPRLHALACERPYLTGETPVFKCVCGASAHNAALDRLRAMLDERTT